MDIKHKALLRDLIRQGCDGLHDEGAPIHYLCSRCFPDPRGDLTESPDDEYDEDRRDEPEEME